MHVVVTGDRFTHQDPHWSGCVGSWKAWDKVEVKGFVAWTVDSTFSRTCKESHFGKTLARNVVEVMIVPHLLFYGPKGLVH